MHDVVTDDDVDHIVMELIEARTLTEVVTADGPLDERTATAVAQQLVAALNTAHSHGVVHRDVKPSNVMLGTAGRVKLTDFGIAQAADDPRLTTSGSLIGSPGYMAPERLDDGTASPASDLWSLGATLYYAMTGTSPFARDTTAATISAVLNADVPTIPARGAVGTVIAGLLQRVPQARLSGVQAAALLAPHSTVPMPGRGGEEPATAPIPVARSRRRRWLLPVAALVLGLVVGAGAVVALRPSGPVAAVLTYGGGGEIPVFDSSYPQCLQGQLVAGRQFPAAAAVSCSGPHDLELFKTFATFGSSDELSYPGRPDLAAYGTSACALAFDSDLIVPTGKDGLRVAVLVPSEAAFAKRATPTSSFTDRDVMCLLRAADGSQLTSTRIKPPA